MTTTTVLRRAAYLGIVGGLITTGAGVIALYLFGTWVVFWVGVVAALSGAVLDDRLQRPPIPYATRAQRRRAHRSTR